jgi:hypothetical protein
MALKDPAQLELLKKKKPAKYRNCRVKFEGKWFDSKKELAHYQWLKMLEANGNIRHLSLQPRFRLIVKNKKICTYVADFEYFDVESGWTVVDVKGFRTKEYKLKKALFEVLYPRYNFLEV